MNKGKELFDEQEIILNKLIKNIENKSENQKKTLIQTILPRIAFFKLCYKMDYQMKKYISICKNT